MSIFYEIEFAKYILPYLDEYQSEHFFFIEYHISKELSNTQFA